MKLKVKDNPGLVRDSKSKAIISEDIDSYNAYIQERNFRSQVQTVEKEVSNLKNEISDIKALLQQLVESSANK